MRMVKSFCFFHLLFIVFREAEDHYEIFHHPCFLNPHPISTVQEESATAILLFLLSREKPNSLQHLLT